VSQVIVSVNKLVLVNPEIGMKKNNIMLLKKQIIYYLVNVTSCYCTKVYTSHYISDEHLESKVKSSYGSHDIDECKIN